MIQRYTKLAFVLGIAMLVGGCHHNKVENPIANVDSKQPDKVLFDRSMDAMKHGKYDVARITLQTLINTYPDSEFIARAKLAVGDSWYAEGTTAAYQQAEVEYKDFQTFFPNLPEAAEAQLRIADMHYKQMEKPDRDYTHAMRAEDEYRQLIQQYPDNTKLVSIAKQRLREVQEVLAERQYRIGHFYFLRESYPAAIARLKTLTDSYPLYSQADDALMLLGQAYQNEATLIKNSKMAEAFKMRLVKQYEANAAEAYSRLIQRYPISDRANDARARLKDMGQPIPTPTKEAIAENKAEEASRSQLGHISSVMTTFHKAPDDLVRASKVGEPTLVDPHAASAPEIIRAATGTALGLPGAGGNDVSAQPVGADATKSEPVPRSDAAAAPDPGSANPAPTDSNPAAAATPTPAGTQAAPPTNSERGIGELTPAGTAPPATQAAAAQTAGGDSGATGSAANGSTQAPPQAPAQVNEIQSGSAATSTSSSTAASSTSSTDSGSSTSTDQNSSSSKKKKKKGLGKLNPF